MKVNILKATIVAALLIAGTDLFAQPGGVGGGQGQGGPPPSSGAVPIDGGAVMLVAGAAAYGRKFLKRSEDETKTEAEQA